MLANVLFPFIHNYVTNKIHVSFYFFSYSLLKKNKNPLTHESGKSLCSRVQENAILHKDSANTMHNYNVYLNVKAEVCTHICVCVCLELEEMSTSLFLICFTGSQVVVYQASTGEKVINGVSGNPL